MAASLTNVIVGTTTTYTGYTSVGCNRTPHALDWRNNDLVCFASSRNIVAVYDLKKI